MLRFTCPNCQTLLVVQVRFVGQGVKCSQCKQLLKVPEPPVAKVAPSRRKIATLGIVIAGIFLVLVGFFIGRLTSSSTSGLLGAFSGSKVDFAAIKNRRDTPLPGYNQDEMKRLKSKLRGKTTAEVQELLGAPDMILTDGAGGGGTAQIFGGPGRGSGALEYQRELQLATLNRDSGDEEWVYNDTILNPVAGAAKMGWVITFHHGRVSD
jgi:predicted Zn finger-like uncharacterized protein